jgi:hypothetical protein
MPKKKTTSTPVTAATSLPSYQEALRHILELIGCTGADETETLEDLLDNEDDVEQTRGDYEHTLGIHVEPEMTVGDIARLYIDSLR